MATQVFFRNASSATPDIFSLGGTDNNLAGSAVGWREQALSLSRGASANSENRTTVAGPTNGIEIDDAGGISIHFISPPLDQDVTIAGTITLNLRCSETNMSANCAINAIIERIDSTGARASTIAQTARTTEMAVTTETAENFTVSPTSTNMLKGDRLRIRVYADDSTANMGSGFSVTFWFNGPTAAASGDSYVTFTENFAFQTTDPTGSQIFLTDTASDVSTASVDREAWTARGAGVQSDVTNTANGPTAPIQITDTAGGTVVDWFTKQLQATTLSGVAFANICGLESNVAANATHRVEIARVDADGTNPTVWAATTHSSEWGTSEANGTMYVAGADLAISDGQRLRLRLFIDDDNISSLVSGHTVTNRYAGTSGGGSGDTFITFEQTLSQFSASPDRVPRLTPYPQLLAH